MSAKYGKILNHPDRDQITSKLASGDSVRSVAYWIKKKYPNDKRNHIAYQTLDEFRKNHLNIRGTVLTDLKEKYKEQQLAEIEEELDIVVSKNKTYNQLKKDALKKHIDIEERMLEIFHVMESRVEHLYNQSIKNPNSYKGDYVLIQYFGKFLDYIKEIKKSRGEPDQIIQHNVTIQAMDQQAAIIQQAIQEAVAELDLETGSVVMEKIISKIEKLKYKENNTILSDKEENQVAMLESKFLQLDDEG